MKKYIKSTLLLILFCTIPLSSQMLHHLDQGVIDKKAIAIETMLTRQKYAMVFFTALGVASNLYFFYSFFTPLKKAGDEAHSNAIINQENIEKKSFMRALVEDCKKFGVNTKDLFCTQEGWWRIAKVGLALGGEIGMYHMMQKIAREIQHPDTLYWYTATKAPYKQTTAMIKKLARRLHYEILTDEQLQNDSLMLQLSCNQLAHYGESVCGYMTYKIKALEETNQQDMAQAAARYLFNYHNDWLAQLSCLFGGEKPDYQKIIEMVVSYEAELAYQFKNFASIEGETKDDRRAVKYAD